MIPHFSLKRLSFSLLCFALLATLVTTLFFALLIPVAPNLKDLALAGVPAVVLCSILFWWLLVVRPQRVTVIRGVLAGILSVVPAPLLMFVIWGIASGQIFQGPMPVLFLGALAMVAVTISPLGWILMVIGGSIGGLLAFFTRCGASNDDTAEQGVSSFPFHREG